MKIPMITVFFNLKEKPPAAVPCVVREVKRSGVTKIVVATWCGHEHEAAAGMMQLPAGVAVCLACEAKVTEFAKQLGMAV